MTDEHIRARLGVGFTDEELDAVAAAADACGAGEDRELLAALVRSGVFARRVGEPDMRDELDPERRSEGIPEADVGRVLERVRARGHAGAVRPDEAGPDEAGCGPSGRGPGGRHVIGKRRGDGMSTRPGWWQDLDAEDFAWQVPERFNIAADSLDAHPAEALAILERGGSRELDVTFGELRQRARRIARWLLENGLERGDRVAVLLPQCWELAAVHSAIYYAGLVAVPLTTKFGPEAVRFRVEDSGARALFGRPADLARSEAGLDSLEHVVSTEEACAQSTTTLSAVLAEETGDHILGDTAADDPALLIYTSGTTGSPKGALHAHRVLVGHMPGVRMTHDGFPQPGDLIWTPAEWAWIGGLLDVLFPSLACGVPVVGSDARVSPELAVRMFDEVGVRNSFMPPTALKQMRAQGTVPAASRVRTLASGGEPLGEHVQQWAREVFGVEVNEFYGQTEMNMTVGQHRQRRHPAPGSMGRAVPGFTVTVLGPDGQPAAAGEVGEIAVLTPNPGEFLGYWGQPERTAEKYAGDWLLTGDLGTVDAVGDLTFQGRADDVISSAGYRIGPGEVEESLLGHPDVALAAVVGEPDELRGQAVVAHVVLREGVRPTDALRRELAAHVKSSLAYYQYPRRIEFHDVLPMTTTGKIQRRLLRGT
ncbi:AMP-binding protein [Brevibacterium album]|uniref:AMP-binding protein n=1 Tax=Brevibacterium album TaxID=417948 RepID=UPI000429F4C3|nr:AMP-binding protein [Brevibacterium album]